LQVEKPVALSAKRTQTAFDPEETMKIKTAILTGMMVLAGFSTTYLTTAIAQDSKSAAGAKVYFVNLKDGDTVSSPVAVKFGLSGMGIAPAGLQGDATANTGHHHLLINAKIEGEGLKGLIPADEKHVHFGKGQTEASVTLPPGQHTLQLVLGDWTHIPHDPPVMSERITITVK
jgi:Domain of unknown function (DUF4399)